MSNKADRGTKRTCQECEARFYDLDRDPITCPICGVVFKLEEPEPAPAPKAKPAPAPEPVKVAKAEETKDEEETADPIEDELAEIESDDTEASTDEDDNTFLETDDDDTNVSDMLGGAPVAKTEEDS